MKATELREMAPAELEQALDELYQEQLNLRFQKSTGQLSDMTRIKEVRRDIARIRTVVRELELAEVE